MDTRKQISSSSHSAGSRMLNSPQSWSKIRGRGSYPAAPGMNAGAQTKFCPIRFRSYAQDLSKAVLELSREYQMGIKLQGIAAKVAKLQHDAEFEAEKLDQYVEEVAARVPTAFSGARQTVDDLAGKVGDVEALVAGVEAVSNGGPALEDQKPEAPVINLVPIAS